MKNKIFYLFVILAVVLMLSSCFTLLAVAPRVIPLFIPRYSLVIDEYNPPEQNASILFPEWSVVHMYNDYDIEDRIYGGPPSWGDGINILLTFPAGHNSIIFDYHYRSGILVFTNSSFPIKGAELIYDFEAGKKYELKTRVAYNNGIYEFFMSLHDTTGKSEMLEEWKIGEYER